MGISPLAFVPKSAAELQQLAHDYNVFDSASTVTTSDVTKFTKKGPPSLPTGFADCMSILHMLETVLKHFFTVRCDAWIKLRECRAELEKQGRLVMGNLSILGSLLPNTIWAIIKDLHQFFNTLSTKDDVDRDIPNAARSTLSLVAEQLCNLQHVQLLDMPTMLKAPFMLTVDPTTSAHSGNSTRSRNPKRGADTNAMLEEPPLHRPNSKDKKTNKVVKNYDPPGVLANDPELQQLLTKLPTVTLTSIAKAAGYDKFTSVPRGDLTKDACGPWIVKQQCVEDCFVSRKIGKNAHVPARDCSVEGCKILLHNLRPGIKSLLDSA